MSNSQAAKRYALALFQVAQEQKALDIVEEELRVVKEAFTNNPTFTSVLASPKLPLEKKKELVKKAFKSANGYVLNTLMVLIDGHRTGEVVEVCDQFIELTNESKGTANAKVYSVKPLTDDQKKALSSAFAPKVGKKALEIENITDSELLGGIKLRIGNRIFDGSLRGKLNRLERKLLG